MTQEKRRTRMQVLSTVSIALAYAALAAAPAGAQGIDLCGCAGSPNSLGAFDSNNESTYPPGTTRSSNNITMPLPPDGVLIFDSFRLVDNPASSVTNLFITPNAANTPVTILSAGNVTLGTNDFIFVDAAVGSNGQDGVNGVGGRGGPGAFAGGDGAYQLVNLADRGGDGIGPGGGAGATISPAANSQGGIFVGNSELLPLVGGSGGGGGRSTTQNFQCSAGGGGGGGGAILIVSNGRIRNSGRIEADGGNGGFRRSGSCSTSGSGGSGGAIRLVANLIDGSGIITANAGTAPSGDASNGLPGSIRMEAFTNNFSATGSSPVAIRSAAPGPIVNPVTPTVEITAVDGVIPPADPQGFKGQIDIFVPAPGDITVDLETSDVPAGTTVEVTAKRKAGAGPVVESTTLDAPNCDSAGVCVAAAVLNLNSGPYILEARATFQTP